MPQRANYHGKPTCTCIQIDRCMHLLHGGLQEWFASKGEIELVVVNLTGNSFLDLLEFEVRRALRAFALIHVSSEIEYHIDTCKTPGTRVAQVKQGGVPVPAD